LKDRGESDILASSEQGGNKLTWIPDLFHKGQYFKLQIKKERE
jgi:hypothetical protein